MNLKEWLEEYRRYQKMNNAVLTLALNGKKKSLLQFLTAMRFGNRYGDELYRRFGITNGVEYYAYFLEKFGKKAMEIALNDTKKPTSQVVEEMLSVEDLLQMDPKDLRKDYILSNLKESYAFNHATGLELHELEFGSYFVHHQPSSYGNKKILDFLTEQHVDKEVFREIYEMYQEEIISEFMNDDKLRNKSILTQDIAKNGAIQDHVTHYSPEDYQNIFQKYFQNEPMTKTEIHILLGLLQKETDFIATYTVENLKKHPEYIKAEVASGIFEDIVVREKTFTNDERKQRAFLSGIWKKEDFERYSNLEKLKQRVDSLPKTEEHLQILKQIEQISGMSYAKLKEQGEEIKELMEDMFLEYEIDNRNHIIESVYQPENEEVVVIDDLSKMDCGVAMLHFFQAERNMSTFESYIEQIEETRSKSLGREVKLSEEEKKRLLPLYQASENHFLPEYHLNFEGVAQVGTFDERYVTNTSNQQSAMVVGLEDLIQNASSRGVVALGFSRATLHPELIATISDHNIHSNKGIDYVESVNPFLDFSATYAELTSEEAKKSENTEIVLYRNSEEASLKPSYVMYLANNKLDSQSEQKNIEQIKKQMEEAGLKVPLVILDREAIREKMKQQEASRIKTASEEER